jgi:hypothetical protein
MKPLLDDKQLEYHIKALQEHGNTLVKNFFQSQQLIKASGLDCYEKPSPMGYMVVLRNSK